MLIIADLAEGRIALTDDIRAHLASCNRCAAEKAWLERLLSLAHDATFEEPPPPAVMRVKALFRQLRRPVPLGQRLLQSILRFDSAVNTPAFGLRAAAARERQILLDAEGYIVDLRITPLSDRHVVAGQILGASPGAPASAELIGPLASVQAQLNDLSEFTLPHVPAGRYSLTITLGESVIHIPELELGS